MTEEVRVFSPGDEVQSSRFGVGRVELDKHETVIVRFAHGLEECTKSDLGQQLTPAQSIAAKSWDAPLEVIVRCQAEAIQSVNNAWGVFSRSRITLLPHQLWVCKRILERWPARWLVADDVGLGKTIEAGLVLWPLLARGAVKRILVLCPASLVEQWQYRLREMFDIRLSIHSSEIDTPRSDFWNTHQQVVASLQTMRLERGDRQKRLLESDPWDLLIVDEAHHLNADEQSGSTLGYKLVEELGKQGKATSMIFFTGTPHRGKDYGFWSLLHLLYPDRFDPRKPVAPQLALLKDVMIRNNKQNVTDLQGRKLFQPLDVTMEAYQYSDAEANFYEMLTEFITSGKAYASGLSAQDQRMVILVLIAMQKLASSSVAAIRRALKNRLKRITDARLRLEQLAQEREEVKRRVASEYEGLEAESDFDLLNQKEEDELSQLIVQLMANEEPRLQELIVAADTVVDETKIHRIMDVIDERFRGEPVLLFTEYKATQSMVMSELIKRHGDGCVAFINGDGRAEDVVDSAGRSLTLTERRNHAADKFNKGEVRFLVSTEAGGEGIDLQESCHVLFHVDLPWNPMRLHQRTGRLNRYGQTNQVNVVGFRNPDTVEALIWEKLDQKLDTIMRAFGHAMEDPEDLKQMVIGMASPSMFRELFSDAGSQPREAFDSWFDQRTARFGGQDAIDTVRELIGNATKFDFAEASQQIPKVDLQDLLPFFKATLTLNGRNLREEDNLLTFRTPQVWANQIGVRATYENMVLDRHYRGEDANQRILGVGHPIVNLALNWAERTNGRVATIHNSVLDHPLLIYRIEDSVTATGGTMASVIVGLELGDNPSDTKLLRDWELLLRLNSLAEGRGVRRARESAPPSGINDARIALEEGQRFVEDHLSDIDLPFIVPQIAPLAVLWPGDTGTTSETDVEILDSQMRSNIGRD